MLIMLDFETTTFLNPYSTDPEDQPGITQIGAIKYNEKLEEVDHFETYINPELRDPSKWTEDAQIVSNIRPADVADAPNFFAAFPRFAEFFRGTKILSGFNIVDFDVHVLHWQLVRYGCQFQFPWPPLQIDVMHLASEWMDLRGKRGRKYPKLGEIYQELFQIELEGAHNALIDCRGTGDVLRAMGGLQRFGYA